MPEPFKTVRQLATELGVDPNKVLTWIHTGELRAIDVSERRGGRPRWRIPLEAWADFQRARSNTALPSPRQKTRKTRKTEEVIEFY